MDPATKTISLEVSTDIEFSYDGDEAPAVSWLPAETWVHILRHLRDSQLINVKCSCKALNKFAITAQQLHSPSYIVHKKTEAFPPSPTHPSEREHQHASTLRHCYALLQCHLNHNPEAACALTGLNTAEWNIGVAYFQREAEQCETAEALKKLFHKAVTCVKRPAGYTHESQIQVQIKQACIILAYRRMLALQPN